MGYNPCICERVLIADWLSNYTGFLISSILSGKLPNNWRNNVDVISQLKRTGILLSKKKTKTTHFCWFVGHESSHHKTEAVIPCMLYPCPCHSQ